MSNKTNEFTGWRSLFWPIHNFEIKKFVPLALILSGILFNYTVLRNLKDALILGAADAGTLTFLKLYCVTPAAILFFMLYAKMSNYFNKETIFYALCTPFLVFFALFALVLNPFADVLQPSAETIAAMRVSLPNLGGFINILGNWIYSLFFIMAELWGSVMVSLAFWQFANQITKIDEAKRFYGSFSVVSNLALILCGVVVTFCSTGIQAFLPEGTGQEVAWNWTINILMILMVIIGIAVMYLYKWVHKNVLTDPKLYDGPKESKKKTKMGLVESVKLILSSKELGYIVMLVVCYGISINLVEVQWKNQVKLYFHGDKALINAFMGKFASWTGIITVLFALTISSNVLRRFGWFVAALCTPLMVAALGSLFFMLIFSAEVAMDFMKSFMEQPLFLVSVLGAVIVIASKATKYTLFDATKEMAYIPLEDNVKTKGKAAVDVVGGRLGKSGGAFVQSTLLMLMGTTDVLRIAGIAFGVFLLTCMAWMYVVGKLSAKIDSNAAEKAAKAK
jgi:AAA family ATP:ADP antiporter